MALNFNNPVGIGEIRLVDYENTMVRFMFRGNPYGLAATDLATARASMITLADKLSDLTGLDVLEVRFGIKYEQVDTTKALTPDHKTKWTVTLAVMDVALKRRVMEIPCPVDSLFAAINVIDLDNVDLLAYADLFSAIGGPKCGLWRTTSMLTNDGAHTDLMGQAKISIPEKKGKFWF